MSWVAMLPRELSGQLAAHAAWLHQEKVGNHVMAAVTMIISKEKKKPKLLETRPGSPRDGLAVKNTSCPSLSQSVHMTGVTLSTDPELAALRVSVSLGVTSTWLFRFQWL